MIKRILVALDPDQDTKVATRYASELARRFDAEVSGLAIVHTQRINAEVGPGGAIGGQYYAEKVRASLTDETRQAASTLLDMFETDLETAQVEHRTHMKEGVPYRRIIEEMKYHDLLVIGRSPHFFYTQPEKSTHTLARVVKEGITPTLIAPPSYRPVKKVLVAYDGSDAAARTLQAFAQMKPFGLDLVVEIVHVRGWVSEEVKRSSELMLRMAGAYLRAHAFEDVRETSLEMESTARRMLSYAEKNGFDLIVAGAHSVSAINRLAFGSTTHTLLKQCPVPFFMYH